MLEEYHAESFRHAHLRRRLQSQVSQKVRKAVRQVPELKCVDGTGDCHSERSEKELLHTALS